MGYKVTYTNNGMERFAISKPRKGNTKINILLWIAVIVLLASFGSSFNKAEKNITETAFQHFVDDVKNGEGFVDAVTVFCRDIIESANVN